MIPNSLSMDEWVKIVKGIGPDLFKSLALAFARERWQRAVQYTDGKGDGGVDAWIIESDEPLVRRALQFHAGTSDWMQKLRDDVATMATYRDSLAADNPKRLDFRRLHFVCTQTPALVDAERLADKLLDQHQIRVDVLDARAIASLAAEREGSDLWRLLAARVDGFRERSKPPPNARDEALLAFAFFHEKPGSFRRAVAKSAIATILHRTGGTAPLQSLRKEAADLLRVSPPSRQVEVALGELKSAGLVSVSETEQVAAAAALITNTEVSLALAAQEKDQLRSRCYDVLEARIAKGKHHRSELATRAVDALLDDIGLLVRLPIAEEVFYSTSPGSRPQGRYERESVKRWRSLAERLTALLELDAGGFATLSALVKTVASDPYAHRIAAAELFLQLTEHDAHELATALSAPAQCILVDASIAMPMLCALYDGGAIPGWTTSQAAWQFYESATARGASLRIADVHLEEMAAHLNKAAQFSELLDRGDVASDLARSKNFFVAHFAGSDRWTKSREQFFSFLQRFGLPNGWSGGSFDAVREPIERELRDILGRYEVTVENFKDTAYLTRLPNEPIRDEVLLEHDRAVVYALARRSRKEAWLLCSADTWLRGVLNTRGIVALDSVGFADLLSLVRPNSVVRTLLSPLELASSLDDALKVQASAIWDIIVAMDSPRLSDGDFIDKAREFRRVWLSARRDGDADIADAWRQFRESGTLAERTSPT